MPTPPFRYEVVKTYPERGPLHQYRVAQATAFICHRCGDSKTSKLVTLLEEDWEHPLCNGCYGRLLSIWDVKSGTLPEDERADQLRAIASKSISHTKVDEARSRFAAAWFGEIAPQAQAEIATAKAIVAPLQNANGLDWSCVVLLLCKAVEIELVARVFEPLRASVAELDLSEQISDKEFTPIAKYCSGRGKEPELGTMGRFVSTAANSNSRLQDPLTTRLRQLSSRWTFSDWLFDKSGLVSHLETLSSEYRNPAAHLTLLEEAQYSRCSLLVTGDQGLLASLVMATKSA